MRKTEWSWPARWTARAARVEDVDLILDLVNARSRKLFGEDQATRESVAGFLSGPRQDLHRDVCIVLDEDACLAGVAFAVNPGPPYADIACAAACKESRVMPLAAAPSRRPSAHAEPD